MYQDTWEMGDGEWGMSVSLDGRDGLASVDRGRRPCFETIPILLPPTCHLPAPIPKRRGLAWPATALAVGRLPEIMSSWPWSPSAR